MHIHIYIHTYTNIHIHICIYIYIYIHHPHCRAWHVTPEMCMPGGADIYTYIYTYIYIYIYVYIHRNTSPFLPGVACNTRLCMPGGAYIYMYIYININIRIYSHTLQCHLLYSKLPALFKSLHLHSCSLFTSNYIYSYTFKTTQRFSITFQHTQHYPSVF